MKKYLASLVCAAALLPGVSAASEFFSSDSLTFAPASSSFTVDFSWADALFSKTTKNAYSTTELDGRYSWVLTDLTTNKIFAKDRFVADSISGDTNGVLRGSFAETFSSLTAGHNYKLLFTGSWEGGHHGRHWDLTNTPGVTLTAAVPEPETYAMLLAGFGLIGTMVRRRRPQA